MKNKQSVALDPNSREQYPKQHGSRPCKTLFTQTPHCACFLPCLFLNTASAPWHLVFGPHNNFSGFIPWVSSLLTRSMAQYAGLASPEPALPSPGTHEQGFQPGRLGYLYVPSLLTGRLLHRCLSRGPYCNFPLQRAGHRRAMNHVGFLPRDSFKAGGGLLRIACLCPAKIPMLKSYPPA